MSPSLHLHPINVVVYNDPEKSNLVAGSVSPGLPGWLRHAPSPAGSNPGSFAL